MKLRIILNQECNLRCIYCYKEGIFSCRKNLLSSDDFKIVIECAKEVGFDELKFTGGEPTISPLLGDLISYGNHLGYRDIRITTNGIILGSNPKLLHELKSLGLNGITLTVNSVNFLEYSKMTLASKSQFDYMLNSMNEIVKLFKEKTSFNVVVTKFNLDSIQEVIKLGKKFGAKVKLLNLVNEKDFSDIYIPHGEIIQRFKGDNVSYVNSCCPTNDCTLCKKLYPIVRLSPDGKINACITDESREIDILGLIKSKNKAGIKRLLIGCLENKGVKYECAKNN